MFSSALLRRMERMGVVMPLSTIRISTMPVIVPKNSVSMPGPSHTTQRMSAVLSANSASVIGISHGPAAPDGESSP